MTGPSIGGVIVTRTPDGPRIDQADPCTLISAEMVDEIERGWGADWITLTDDDVLTFNATNRRVVYRLHRDRYDWQQNAYVIDWPD